jgi:hypothetical protein
MKKITQPNAHQLKNRRDFLKSGALAGSLLIFPGLKSFASSLSDQSKTTNQNNYDLLTLGLIDVTASPYNADPTGITDSTKAIQQAVYDAREKSLICFLPTGTYLISDTIDGEIPVYKLPVGNVTGPNSDACGRYMATDGTTQHYWSNSSDRVIMLGSTKGARPVLKLAPNTAGFQNSASPKLVVKIWAQTRNDRGTAPDPPNCLNSQPNWGVEQANISFNNVFKGIDIDLGRNPGAIGIRHTGSQGCYMMDSKIIADGALAGMSNCCGQGGGTYNIEVQGGQHGIRIDKECRFPMLASCIFKGQTVASVYTTQAIGGYLPLVMVGCLFEPDGPKAIDISVANGFPGVNLIDCVVKLSQPGVIVNTKTGGEIVFLENVITQGATKVQSVDTQIIPTDSWINISRYSFCKAGKNLINGVISSETFFEFLETQTPDYNLLHQRHWTVLPSFEDADSANVRDFGAVGNGTTDDTDAFKKALAASNKVFVPKGTYKVNETLELGANNHLFGLPKAYTSVTSNLSTVDSLDAVTGLSFISINGTTSWKAGKGIYAFASGTFNFSGNGGGRFFGLTGRKVISGNTQPVWLYAYNVERVQQNPMSIIQNAKNVKIFYLKVEAGTASNDSNTPMRISNSQNVRIYCVSGNVVTLENRPMVDVVDSKDVLVSQVKSFKTGTFPNIRETIDGKSTEIPSSQLAALYIRDIPTSSLELQKYSTVAYPNPFNHSFTIEVPENVVSYEIQNIWGNVLNRQKIGNIRMLKIDLLANQPDGIYFLTLIGVNKITEVIKLIKE